jgi:ribosomal protein S18 acetylase RimI-like enzyme
VTSVRPATREDAGAVIAIRIASWNEAYAAHLPDDAWAGYDIDAATRRLADSIDAGTLHVLVAERSGAVVGYTMSGAPRDEDVADGTREIYAIYVHPDAWSTGAGRALMTETISTLGDGPVVLWVLEDNARARRFYERAGYVADGARKDAEMPGGPVPEVRYRRGATHNARVTTQET